MTFQRIFSWLAAALLLVIVLKDCTGCRQNDVETRQPIIDSLKAAHAASIDSLAVIQIGYQWEIRDLNMARRWDSVAISKALQTIKPLNSKVTALIDANKDLKAANDTLSRLNNCDTLAEYAGYLVVQVDSLQQQIPRIQSSYQKEIALHEKALASANDKALIESRFRQQAVYGWENCEREKVVLVNQKDPVLIIGPQLGYGMTEHGLTPYLGVGITYRIKIGNQKK